MCRVVVTESCCSIAPIGGAISHYRHPGAGVTSKGQRQGGNVSRSRSRDHAKVNRASTIDIQGQGSSLKVKLERSCQSKGEGVMSEGKGQRGHVKVNRGRPCGALS